MLKNIESTVSANQKEISLKECRRFLIGIVQNLQGRNPILSSLVRCAFTIIDRTNMAIRSQSCIIKFDALVDRLHQHGRRTGSEGDGAKSDFRDFLQNVVRSSKDEFTLYDFSTT